MTKNWIGKLIKKELYISTSMAPMTIDISKESKEEILGKFSNIDAIFIAGGNSFYLLQQLKIKNVLQELINFANNKIYVGSSAGSCIACPSIDYVEKLDNKSQVPLLDNIIMLCYEESSKKELLWSKNWHILFI